MGILGGLTPVKDIEPCKVGRMLLDLEPSDAQILIEALTDERWSPTGLSKALGSRGLRVTADTLRAHMTKVCRCSKI